MANTELGSAYVTIIPSMKGFQKKVTSSIESTFGGVKGIIAGTFSTAAVSAFGKAALDAYANYEQLVGGIDTLFKDASGKVQKYAAEAYKTSGLSANRYMEQVTSFSASLTQSLGGDTQKAADYADQAIRDMSDNANKMGSSMRSIEDAYQGFAKQNYTMLDNLKLGYGGTKAEMERLIQDANRVKVANGDMADLSINSFADVTEAIHIIQTEMGITGTTAQEASETIAGSISSAQSAWENWLTGLGDDNADMQALTDQLVQTVITAGENIVPRLGEIAGSLGETLKTQAPIVVDKFLTAISESLPPGFKEAFDTAVEGLKGTVETLKANFDPFVQTLKDIAPAVGGAAGAFIMLKGAMAISDLIGTVRAGLFSLSGITTLLTNAQLILNAVMNMNPFFRVATVIGLLVGAFVTLWTTNEGFRAAVTQAWETIKAKAFEVFGAICNFFTVTVPQAISDMANWFSQLPGQIASGLTSAVNKVKEFANNVKNKAVEAGKNFLNGVKGGFEEAIHFVANIPNRVLNALGDLGSLLIESGKSMLKGLAEGIKQGVSNAIDAVKNGLSEIRSFFPFSPAKRGPFSGHGWVSYSGESIARAMGEGFTRGVPSALRAFEGGMGRIAGVTSALGASAYDVGGASATSTVRVVGERDAQLIGMLGEILRAMPESMTPREFRRAVAACG